MSVAGVPFIPFKGGTKTISATTSSSEVVISGSPSQLLIYNSGTVPAFIRFGVGTQTAVATTDTPIPPASERIFTCPGSTTNIAGITASGTATVYVTPGAGE